MRNARDRDAQHPVGNRGAESRVAEAMRAEDNADASAKAQRALDLAASIATRGKKLDAALLLLAQEAEGFEEDLAELNMSGFTHPSLANFKAIVERPFFAALMIQPSGKRKGNGQPADGTLKLRHLPPGERMTFSEIAEGYALAIRRSASVALGDKAEAA